MSVTDKQHTCAIKTKPIKFGYNYSFNICKGLSWFTDWECDRGHTFEYHQWKENSAIKLLLRLSCISKYRALWEYDFDLLYSMYQMLCEKKQT